MNRLPYLILFLMLWGGSHDVLRSQDDELGGLPPIPDLDLGDPERKQSFREKKASAQKAKQASYQNSTYTRQASDQGAATIAERLEGHGERRAARMETQSNEITVQNNIGSADDAVTASGSRLQAFGEEDRWAGIPEPTWEESLIDLPPMPDLRTPDQITSRERARDRRVASAEVKRAEAELKRQEAEAKARATVTVPGADPANALVQVQSRAELSGTYMGNEAAPETVDSGTLRPFDANSSYYKDNQKVYQGAANEKPLHFWWRRGTTVQGEEVAPPDRLTYNNPFKGARDVVQPVSFGPAGGAGDYASSAATLDATPLSSNIRGIRVVRTTRDVSTSAVSGLSGLVSEGVDLPPRVSAVFEAQIGRSLTLGQLNQLVRDAVLAYRKSDLPVVDVLVPEQEITTGVLQLVIIEGRLGDVIVEGGNRAESRALASQIRTNRGEIIRESNLTEDLAWINKHPTRQVDLIFTPGSGYGETDVILRSQTYRELSAYIAYENSGTDALGDSRGIFGASWTGPAFLGLDSILSYQFTTNFDDRDSSLTGHSGVFASYLPWRHQITLLGAYVESSSSLDQGGGVFLNSVAENKQLSGRYGIPLPQMGAISHELEIGMDFKSALVDNNLGGVPLVSSITEVVQYSLGYNMIAADDTGVWRFDSEIVSSPGDNTDYNNTVLFNTQRAGATATYTYGRISLERDQQLWNDWSMFARVQGQLSNGNLLSSETLGAGGYDSVRGFEQRIQSGDNGIVGTVELRTPTFYPSTFAGVNGVRDGAIGLIFWDAAKLSNVDPTVPGVEEEFALGSVGSGFRYQIEDDFTLRVDYGFQVTEDGFTDVDHGRWHVGATATF